MSKSRCLDSEELAINRQKFRIFHIKLQIEYSCQKLWEYLYQGKSPGTTRLEPKVPKRSHTLSSPAQWANLHNKQNQTQRKIIFTLFLSMLRNFLSLFCWFPEKSNVKLTVKMVFAFSREIRNTLIDEKKNTAEIFGRAQYPTQHHSSAVHIYTLCNATLWQSQPKWMARIPKRTIDRRVEEIWLHSTVET